MFSWFLDLKRAEKKYLRTINKQAFMFFSTFNDMKYNIYLLNSHLKVILLILKTFPNVLKYFHYNN